MSSLRGIMKSRVPSDWLQGDGKQQLTGADPRDRGTRAIIIMKHNTDRGGDLEVEDDGPY